MSSSSIATSHAAIVFADGAVVDLPTGSRGAQIDAVDAGLGPAPAARGPSSSTRSPRCGPPCAARCWMIPSAGDGSPIAHRQRSLAPRTSLEKLLRKSLRRRSTSADGAAALRDRWAHTHATFPPMRRCSRMSSGASESGSAAGGMAAVIEALVTRLDERGVELRCDCPVAVDRRRPPGASVASCSPTANDLEPMWSITDVDPRVGVRRDAARQGSLPERRAFVSAATPASAADRHPPGTQRRRLRPSGRGRPPWRSADRAHHQRTARRQVTRHGPCWLVATPVRTCS